MSESTLSAANDDHDRCPRSVENGSFFDTFLKLTYAQLMLV